MARLPIRSDEEIVSLMAELRQGSRIVSVAAIRKELWRRYGIRGGSERIYKLFSAPAKDEVHKSTPTRLGDTVNTESEIARLTAERDAALARVELSELREMATQDRTANEIYDLRQEVKRLKVFQPLRPLYGSASIPDS